MIVLFELMIVNQWHVIAAGFVTLTSKYSRIFFIFYHMTTVVVFLKYVQGGGPSRINRTL